MASSRIHDCLYARFAQANPIRQNRVAPGLESGRAVDRIHLIID